MKSILFQGQFKSRIIMLVVIISLSILSPAAQVKAKTNKLADPFFSLEEEQSLLKMTTLNNNDTPPEGFQNIDSSRIETFTMNMPQLDGREKDIIIYLPTDYFSSDEAYPVIYLQNAEEVFVFDRNEDGGGSWILNESLYAFFTDNFTSEFIIVGAVSDPIFIWEEYGPWVNENMYLWMDPYEANRVEGGAGDAYLDFLIQTLKPEIDIRYRTLPDRENTTIGGYDMGGLFSIYTGLTRPNVFSRVIAISPAIWFGETNKTWLSNNQLINLINKIELPKNLSLFVDIAESEKTTNFQIRPAVHDTQGNKVPYPRAYFESAQSLVRTLISKGFPKENLDTSSAELQRRFDPLFPNVEEDLGLSYKLFLPIISTPKIPPTIISPAATTFIMGHNNEFTIETTGGPPPTISSSPYLPEGITFTDNVDGTATFEGNPLGPPGVYQITITASNSAEPDAIQYFHLRITPLADCPDNNSCILEFDINMDPHLPRTRHIYVYLPPNYDPIDDGYQVIYLTSAENIFGTQIDVFTTNDWFFDETLDELYDNSGKGTIAVALGYDSHYPWDEYMPWTNKNMDNWLVGLEVVQGAGNYYLEFIVDVLKPIIDTSYRTLPNSENTAIGGGSRHALFALNAALTHPDTFSKVMAMSPAIWLAEGGDRLPLGRPHWFYTNQLGKWLDNNVKPNNVDYFLHIGTNEWQGTGGDYPYAYLSDGTKLDWADVYLDGAEKIKTKLDLGGDNYHKTSGSHTPVVWRLYVDDALKVLGFYP